MTHKKLLDKYGSPAYVYDLGQLRRAQQTLWNTLPANSVLFYSIKANPHAYVVRYLFDLGCNIEVSSIGELRIALDAGVDPFKCLFTGPGKTNDDILEAMECGVSFFSAESIAELRLIDTFAGEQSFPIKVLLRVNADVSPNNIGLAMMGVSSQFGIDYSQVLAEKESLRSLSSMVQVVGFHFYMASNIQAVSDLLKCFSASLDCAAELSVCLNMTPEWINLGGGFGHPYANNEDLPALEGLAQGLDALTAGYIKKTGNRPLFAFESGRYLVGASGKLLMSVQEVKQSKDVQYVVVDSGINHLGGMAGLRRIPNYIPEISNPEKPVPGNVCESTICGPLCTPLDVLSRKATLPSPERGDCLAISNVGAYGLTGSLIGFLSHPCPVEIIVDGEQVVEVTQLELNRKKIKQYEYATGERTTV